MCTPGESSDIFVAASAVRGCQVMVLTSGMEDPPCLRSGSSSATLSEELKGGVELTDLSTGILQAMVSALKVTASYDSRRHLGSTPAASGSEERHCQRVPPSAGLPERRAEITTRPTGWDAAFVLAGAGMVGHGEAGPGAGPSELVCRGVGEHNSDGPLTVCKVGVSDGRRTPERPTSMALVRVRSPH